MLLRSFSGCSLHGHPAWPSECLTITADDARALAVPHRHTPTHTMGYPQNATPAQPAQVTQEQRDHAKQLTYGILYGMGAGRLATELGCSVGEAKDVSARAQATGWAWHGALWLGVGLCPGPARSTARASAHGIRASPPSSTPPLSTLPRNRRRPRPSSCGACPALRRGRRACWPTASAWATWRCGGSGAAVGGGPGCRQGCAGTSLLAGSNPLRCPNNMPPPLRRPWPAAGATCRPSIRATATRRSTPSARPSTQCARAAPQTWPRPP